MCMNCACEKGTLTTRNGYIVCEKHKVVHFVADISPEKKKEKVIKYLEEKQKAITQESSYYHSIEQKYILGHRLSEDEEVARNNLIEFRHIHTELKLLLGGKNAISNGRVRQLLYRLIVISDWLDKTFPDTVQQTS